jgi:hypothetical protein
MTGFADADSVGTWQDQMVLHYYGIEVPSNILSFEVHPNQPPPYANLSINQQGFHPGDSYLLSLSTNIPNAYFTFCYDRLPCEYDFGQTDQNGNWWGSGVFPNPMPEWLVGWWYEWVEFESTSSNSVHFEVYSQ